MPYSKQTNNTFLLVNVVLYAGLFFTVYLLFILRFLWCYALRWGYPMVWRLDEVWLSNPEEMPAVARTGD